MDNNDKDLPRGVLVGVQLSGVDDAEHASSLAELGRLARTLGVKVIAVVSQRRTGLAAAAVLGEGKLRELAKYTDGTGVVPSAAPAKKRRIDPDEDDEAAAAEALVEPDPDEDAADADAGGEVAAPREKATVVLVDHELTPSQARNLERATGAEVMDRTAVILEIFHRHARSREARLQVEIARLQYVAPRMRESGGGKDRQRGGIGGKGAGESTLELDRRKVRDRIAELRQELATVSREQDVRRSRRQEQLRVALVGYTNAGKSSLMRALTGSEVYVADKLFATLDTTVRPLHPESHPRVLVSDTVGFIKKLPHDLVASFRSTLDEAREASLLLHVVDGADAAWRAQLAVTRAVLDEIGAGDIPHLLVVNKSDRMDDAARAAVLQEFPGCVVLSARDPADVKRLRTAILAWFEKDMVEGELIVPYDRSGVIAEVHRVGRVLVEEYDERGARFRVKALPEALARLMAMVE